MSAVSQVLIRQIKLNQRRMLLPTVCVAVLARALHIGTRNRNFDRFRSFMLVAASYGWRRMRANR